VFDLGLSAPKKVFISYSNEDREKAKEIFRRLTDIGKFVILAEIGLSYEDSILTSLSNKIAASNYLIVLISKHASRSKWLTEELRRVIDSEFKARDVALIPVVLDFCQVPSYMQEYQPIRLWPDFERGIQSLIERIRLIPQINFQNLDGRTFELLVGDLLRSLGFKMVERQSSEFDRQFDFKALYSYRDPFGYSITETWLIETKLYKDSRLDLNALDQAISYLSPITGNYKISLITSGHLTSAARDWLENLQKKEKMQIRVIEGSGLKTLLLKHKKVAEKYFGSDLR
jgi:hypothetical protein